MHKFCLKCLKSSAGVIDTNMASAPRISVERNGGPKRNVADLKPQFQQQDDEEIEPANVDKLNKSRLSGALLTFRLVWPTIVENLTEISLLTLRKVISIFILLFYSFSKYLL